MTGLLVGMKMVTVCVLVVKLQMAIVAGYCLHHDVDCRPTMSVVVKLLELFWTKRQSHLPGLARGTRS